MGWHKTTVDGRVMWESPDGQRVADRADIPGRGREAPTRTVYRTVGGVSVETMVVVALVSLAIGMALGGLVQ